MDEKWACGTRHPRRRAQGTTTVLGRHPRAGPERRPRAPAPSAPCTCSVALWVGRAAVSACDCACHRSVPSAVSISAVPPFLSHRPSHREEGEALGRDGGFLCRMSFSETTPGPTQAAGRCPTSPRGGAQGRGGGGGAAGAVRCCRGPDPGSEEPALLGLAEGPTGAAVNGDGSRVVVGRWSGSRRVEPWLRRSCPGGRTLQTGQSPVSGAGCCATQRPSREGSSEPRSAECPCRTLATRRLVGQPSVPPAPRGHAPGPGAA